MHQKKSLAFLSVIMIFLIVAQPIAMATATISSNTTFADFQTMVDEKDPATAPVYKDLKAAQAAGFSFSLLNGKPYAVPTGYEPSKNGASIDRRINTWKYEPFEGTNVIETYYQDYGSIYNTFHYNSTVHGNLLKPFSLSLAKPEPFNQNKWWVFGNLTMIDPETMKFVLTKDGLGVEYIPVTQKDGVDIYRWYDGSYFCFAKDGCNIMKLGSHQYDWVLISRYDAQNIKNALKTFNAMISATNPSTNPSNSPTTVPGTVQPTTPATTPVTTPVTTPANGLVAHYKFEGNLNDATSQGNNGSEMGSIAYESGGAVGQALKLDKGGYVKIPGSSAINLGEKFTLNAWLKLDPEENDVNRYNTVLFKQHATEPGYFIYKAVASGTHDVRLDLQQLSTGYEPVVSTDGVGTLDLSSKWTMVTWVSNGENLYIYVDGKLKTTRTTGKKEYGTPFIDNMSSDLFIGGPVASSAELFNGQIDEVKLFSKALTGSEIKSEYETVKGTGSHVLQLWIDEYRIVKDGEESDIDSAPMILNGRTMVPVRPVIEAMGGKVAYDSATRRIDLTLKGTKLTLWIDKKKATVNDKSVTLEVAPTIIGGRTMLPLRFAAESLGAAVEWDKTTQMITLKYK